MMVTNAVLGGIADTVAQTITSVRQRAARKPGGVSRDDTLAIEIREFDRKNPLSERDVIPDSALLPPPFDFERLTRFMAYGFCMAPVQFRWFRFLEKTFPIGKGGGLGPALKRMAFDQLILAPFGRNIAKDDGFSISDLMGLGIACFFTAMTLAEGGGKRAVYQKLRDMYVPTLKANFMVWPAVQVINFRLMPVQFQLVSNPGNPHGSCANAHFPTALRLDSRYCLDGISVSHECGRRCPADSVEPELARYPLAVMGSILQVG